MPGSELLRDDVEIFLMRFLIYLRIFADLHGSIRENSRLVNLHQWIAGFECLAKKAYTLGNPPSMMGPRLKPGSSLYS